MSLADYPPIRWPTDLRKGQRPRARWPDRMDEVCSLPGAYELKLLAASRIGFLVPIERIVFYCDRYFFGFHIYKAFFDLIPPLPNVELWINTRIYPDGNHAWIARFWVPEPIELSWEAPEAIMLDYGSIQVGEFAQWQNILLEIKVTLGTTGNAIYLAQPANGYYERDLICDRSAD